MYLICPLTGGQRTAASLNIYLDHLLWTPVEFPVLRPPSDLTVLSVACRFVQATADKMVVVSSTNLYTSLGALVMGGLVSTA